MNSAKKLLLLAAFFFLATQIPDDPDFGIHLGVGRFILENRTFPRVDLFSFSLPNHPYVYHSWLSQVVITALYQWFRRFGRLGESGDLGLMGLSVVWTFLATVGIYLLYRLSNCRSCFTSTSFLITLAFLVVTATVFSSIGVRPQMFTFLFLVVELGILLRWRSAFSKVRVDKVKVRKDRRDEKVKAGRMILFLLIPLFALWVNLHLGFIAGLLVMAVFIMSEILVNLGQRKKERQGEIGVCLAVIILSFLATFINPYGFGVYRQAWAIGQNYYNLRVNLEWAPLVSRGTPHWFLAGIILLVFTFLLREKRVDWSLMITSLILFFLTLRNTRLAMVFLIFFLPLVSTYLSRFPDLFFTFGSWRPDKLPVYLALFLLPLAILMRSLVNFTILKKVVSDPAALAARGGYPLGAVNYLKTHSLPQHLLNYYNWGGYLVWQLPELAVFETGIMDAFYSDGRLFFDDYFALVNAKPNWQVLMEGYSIDAVLLPPETPLLQVLRQQPNWKVVYQDAVSVLMQRQLFFARIKDI